MTARLLLTEQEAAEALRVCSRTLRKARQEGKLPYVLVGRAIRYTSDDLRVFIDNSRQDNPCPKVGSKPKRVAGKSGVIVPFSARR